MNRRVFATVVDSLMARNVRHDTTGKGGVGCDGRGASGALLRHEERGVRISGFTAFGFMV